MSCIVVDLGGTYLRCGIVVGRNEIVFHERTRLDDTPETRGDGSWNEIIATVVRFVSEHALDVARDAPIVFAFPGPVLGDRPVGQAPTVVGPGNVPDISGQLRARTGRDVMMLNDVSAAAWYFESRLAAERFVIVTVSSGIGSKIFDRRHGPGVIDDTSYAGEIGHLVVETGDDVSTCDCGGLGHLGAIASGRGFERLARREAVRDAIAFGASACVRSFGATSSQLNNETHLLPAIAAGDPWATGLLDVSIAPLADVLRVLIVGCGLQGVAITGGFAQRLGAIYGFALTAALGKMSDSRATRVALEGFVTVAGADDEPSLLGAARYAERRRTTQ
jgi:glucokinase